MNDKATRKIIAVHGAKGGVGTSMMATNLGIFHAQIGKQVVLVDADLTGAGLSHWLGDPTPAVGLGELLAGRVKLASQVLVPTCVTGLSLLPGVLNWDPKLSVPPQMIDRFWDDLCNMPVDIVIMDLGAQINTFTLTLFERADFQIVVTLPLPDSVEATYRFMKIAFGFSLMERHRDEPDALESIGTPFSGVGALPAPRQVIGVLEECCPAAARTAEERAATFHPLLVVNQIKIKDDEPLGDAMVSATTRWLGVVPLLLGQIGWDDNVWLSNRRARPLLIDFGGSRACKDLEQIVRRLMSLGHRELFSPILVPPATEEQNYYELLEIYPGASEEEVRRAYRQIKNWFGVEGMAVRGACSDEQRSQFQQLAEVAHAALVDRSERRQYDRTHFPEGVGSSVVPDDARSRSIAGTVEITRDELPKTHIPDDTLVDGFFLGKLRRELGVDLIDISNRAKVSVRYLEAIEQERFDELPAPVFIRGFVTEFARFLKVDPKRAVADVMAKIDSVGGR